MALIELLHRSVQRSPAATALVHGRRRMCYEALWESIGGAVHWLNQAGVTPGGRVGLLLNNSPEYVIHYYAIMAAGGVVVPLNTAARACDLIYQLQHCGASHWVTSSKHTEAVEVARALPTLKVLDADDRVGKNGLIAASFHHDQPAAIVYTSGTTGKPKGVTLSHRNLECNVTSILAYLPLQMGDVMVNVLPFHYSYGNSVLHTHLAVGATLVLDHNMVFPDAVLAAMEREGATGFSGVSANYAILMGKGRPEKYNLGCLRYLTQAGGPMAPTALSRVRKLWPEARFFAMYGQTEATARLTYLPPESMDEKEGSVGIPIPGVEIAIRDDAGHEVTNGTLGEVWARGGNVMLGYWNDAAASREVLHDGWLKTGDVAYKDGDGYIFIRGRKSEMIKSGGHRIGPAEIEEVLSELSAVEEAAVTGVADELLGQVIKAVIIPRQDVDLDLRTVLSHCRQRLPAYKVPKLVEFASALPRTASGKVQRYMLDNPP